MKDRLLQWVLNWLASNLTKEMVELWAEELKAWLVPIIDTKKDEVFETLRAKAAETKNKIDDAAVDALEVLVDSFLPTKPQSL